jgi:hypothetical protein
MNRLSMILFWMFTIGLGFVNPLISFALIVFYYLPGIIEKSCDSPTNSSDMKSFSDDILEEMK